MEFSDVARKLFAAYDDESFGDALDTVRESRPRFPERDSTLTFWEACLLSLTGRPEQAIDTLDAGLDRGLSWHPRMLTDPDLDAARQLDRWPSVLERSSEMVETREVDRPPPLVRRAPEAFGTVVALHGAGHDPRDFHDEWVDVIPATWSVVAPVGDVPMSDLAWAWPFDLSLDTLLAALEPIELTAPIVIAGFSQGAAMAAKAAWNGAISATGLLLSAATLPTDLWGTSQRRPVPMYAVVGTVDRAYRQCIEVAEQLERDDVAVHLDVREGMGHVAPPDLDQVIRNGLDWILAQAR